MFEVALQPIPETGNPVAVIDHVILVGDVHHHPQ
jgi:hypothetical protein